MMKQILSFNIALLFGVLFVSCSKEVIPTGVTLNQTSISLKVGDTFTLTATVSPSSADNQNVKWTSLNANVASVSSGLVSALSPGETSIIATTEAGNQTAACKVIVEEPYKGLSFVSSGTANIVLGKTGSPDEINLEYRKGSGEWSAYTVGTSIELKDKESVSFQATEGGNSKFSKDPENYYQFSISGEGTVAASGNIMSLVSRDMSSLTIPERDFFNKLFENCKNLTKAPGLPATTLASYCYERMFAGCTSLTQAPELPADILDAWCYYQMFSGCTSLTTVPELPVAAIASDSYREMFSGCTSLKTAPELPATTLNRECYCGMFKDCTSLTTAPELPATTLSMGCYYDMFNGCTSLAQAPELPATTLSMICYVNMFADCTSLFQAPELPATTLAMECYRGMFMGCTNLTQAPELPATELMYNCYRSMFSGCTKLNYVKALFTTEPSFFYTENWLSDVAANGTFIKNPSATWEAKITRGENTVPEGWTITNGNGSTE